MIEGNCVKVGAHYNLLEDACLYSKESMMLAENFLVALITGRGTMQFARVTCTCAERDIYAG